MKTKNFKFEVDVSVNPYGAPLPKGLHDAMRRAVHAAMLDNIENEMGAFDFPQYPCHEFSIRTVKVKKIG